MEWSKVPLHHPGQAGVPGDSNENRARERRERGGEMANRVWLRRWATMGLVLGVAVVGCGGEAQPDEQTAVDREMDLAIQEGAAEPELRDVPQEDPTAEPATPDRQPSARTPEERPPAPVEQQLEANAPASSDQPEAAAQPAQEAGLPMITVTAPAGETFRVQLRQEISTRDNQPGDIFIAETLDPLIGGRHVVMPASMPIRGEVTAVQKSGGPGEPAIIKINFLEIVHEGQAHPVTVTVVEADPKSRGRYSTVDKAARIGGGAGAGAIIGAIIGKGKGAVIGAAIGAAAGTAITVATEDVDAVLEAGAILRLRLDEPLVVTVPDPMAN
jgi:hypothetical protein